MPLGIREWNGVNPASEKPKFGRGTFTKELKRSKGRETLDKCLQPKWYKIWLIKNYYKGES